MGENHEPAQAGEERTANHFEREGRDGTCGLECLPQGVDVEYIRDSIDIKNKEQAELDKRFKVLESLSRSPTAPLCQQLSTVSISSPAANPQVIRDPFLGAGGG